MLSLPPTYRLLYQLHVLAHDFASPHDEGTVIAISFRRGHLADLIATDPYSVSRALKELRDAHRIRIMPDRRILVLGYFVAQSAA